MLILNFSIIFIILHPEIYFSRVVLVFSPNTKERGFASSNTILFGFFLEQEHRIFNIQWKTVLLAALLRRVIRSSFSFAFALSAACHPSCGRNSTNSTRNGIYPAAREHAGSAVLRRPGLLLHVQPRTGPAAARQEGRVDVGRRSRQAHQVRFVLFTHSIGVCFLN